MKIITKEELINELSRIKSLGWIESTRQGNAGGIGNTLEDLLGIKENNLPLPNAAEWELKTQRKETTSLTTLFHMEPSPRAIGFVPKLFLPNYGWPHKQAGRKYPSDEMSFRQTISGSQRSDRGFKVVVSREEKKVLVSFDSSAVAEHHQNWLRSVKEKIGLNELNPQPYWGFDDLFHNAGTKLINCFYVVAESKRESGREYFKYDNIYMLKGFSIEKFLSAIEANTILVDFDARTGHNHGTKFRMRQNGLRSLYESVSEIE